jgi:surface polysaccharide O-acyltransferase-like enzyme
MLYNLQILRAFAALNVVYFHIIKSAESYRQPVVLFSFLDGWGANGVDVFFVISGFVMVYTQSVREKKALTFYRTEMKQYPHSRSIKAVINKNISIGNSFGFKACEAFQIARKIEK